MLFFLLVLAESISFRANLEDLQISHIENCKIYKMGNRFVFCEYSDPGLAVTDISGNILATRRNAGQGPEDLNKPMILGIWEDEILMRSNNKNVLAFDRHLNLLQGKYPPLPSPWSEIIMGHGQTAPGNKSFYFISSGLDLKSPFLITRLYLDSKRTWHSGESLFPQVNDFSMKRPVDGNYMIQSANNLLFHSKMSLFLKEENYQVAVYHAPIIGDDEEHISQMLSAPIEDFSPIYGRFRCYISGAFGFENGYAVVLKAKGEGHKGPHLNQFIDLFDRNGKFIRRIQSNLTITPSSNSSEVFVLETKGDNDYLIIQSEWL